MSFRKESAFIYLLLFNLFLEGRAVIFLKNVGFLVDLKTPKGHLEITDL